ncbi:hypothetical protein MAHJHV65_40870 [Mycobacterium avium subsp. hominissuis]
MVSKARRAAAIASFMSPAQASVAVPRGSSVAGLMLVTVAPDAELRNSPLMYNRDSGWNAKPLAATDGVVIALPFVCIMTAYAVTV